MLEGSGARYTRRPIVPCEWVLHVSELEVANSIVAHQQVWLVLREPRDAAYSHGVETWTGEEARGKW